MLHCVLGAVYRVSRCALLLSGVDRAVFPCRDRWEQYSEEEKAGQVLNVVGKMVNEAGDLQESMETRKRQLLLDNGLEWRAFRSYVDIACMYMVSTTAHALYCIHVYTCEYNAKCECSEPTGSRAVASSPADVGSAQDPHLQGVSEASAAQGTQVCREVRGQRGYRVPGAAGKARAGGVAGGSWWGAGFRILLRETAKTPL